MDEDTRSKDESKLTIGEIVDSALTFLDFPAEVVSTDGLDGFHCDMKPEEFELARATIAYLGFRLLLMHRIKHGNVIGCSGGWVGVRHYESEIRKEIAAALGISGPSSARVDEVRRLYKLASKREDEDEAYSERVGSVMETFMEDYDLDPASLGVIFI